MMKTLAAHSPIVETYIQEEALAERNGGQGRDHYFLGRLKLVETVNYASFVKRSVDVIVSEVRPEKKAKMPFFRKPPVATEATGPVGFFPVGFAQMALIDAKSFDRKTYRFDFVRREFLGEVRCLVFDLAPLDPSQAGKFIGRIWVEDQDASVVRVNGTYTLRSADGVYYHFDSWRTQTAQGI
ncbi:MAG: hypothetical protein FJW36_20060 [Acidobacteria bacterium]|nr:hypothetical protein [Acidobacteriota bacterium]